MATDRADEPRRIGSYVLEELLGRGGQGSVWRARDERLGRTVAMKLLTELSADGLARFEREARIASRIDHPGICTIYDTGRDGDTAWIAMQFVAGESLATQIRTLRQTGPQIDARTDAAAAQAAAAVNDVSSPTAPSIPLRPLHGSGAGSAGSGQQHGISQLLTWFSDAARCLHAAHRAGLVHRDVKPANLMVAATGDPVLLDFGLARESENAADLTTASALVGTPEYMAPEQLRLTTSTPAAARDAETRADAVGPRTDIWGLGVTLFEALTLEQPFAAATWSELVTLIAERPIPDPCRRRRGVPRDLRAVLETALEKDPERRYRSAEEFAEDLDRIRRGEPIHARPIGSTRRAMLWIRRHPGWTATAVALALLVAALLWAGDRAAEQRREQVRQVTARARLRYEAADWEGSLSLVQRARDLASGSSTELDLLEVALHVARSDYPAARAVLDRLPPPSDPRDGALVDLWRGEVTPTTPGAEDPGSVLIRAALRSGQLPAAEAAYARALLATDVDTALAAAREAIQLDPRHRRAREVCCLLLQADNPDEARSLASALLEQRPTDTLALTLLSISVRRSDDRAAAQELLADAWNRARLAPTWNEVAEQNAASLEADLAEFLRDFGLFRGLEQGMVQSLLAAERNRDSAPVAAAMRDMLPAIGERVTINGLNLRRHLPRRTPAALDNAWMMFQRALIEVLSNPAAIAEQRLGQLLESRSDGTVLLLRGTLRLREDRLVDAGRDFEAAWSAPSRFDVENLAIVLALHTWRKAWRRAEAFPDVRARARSGLQRTMDRLQAQLPLSIRPGPFDFPPHRRTLLSTAIGFALQMRDLPRAEELADRWRRATPSDPDAWLRHAEVAVALGHLFRARDFARIARQLGPDSARADALLRDIAERLRQAR